MNIRWAFKTIMGRVRIDDVATNLGGYAQGNLTLPGVKIIEPKVNAISNSLSVLLLFEKFKKHLLVQSYKQKKVNSYNVL
ncbi:hypothetical protein [Bacillus sp. OK048]|uniref:hypothetical protein n=1 Tax=Bacillus sp. OK048 TaxID=1882761 RepID=UPI00088606F9|nr:hypothetical protein [Bacillus sp. OK048]SDN52338.1 hypothetical protein SAMN05443253_11359 [Bacillus sp. OK048]